MRLFSLCSGQLNKHGCSMRIWGLRSIKPSCDQCREFMHQIVNMGYATNNGLTGREYKIKILTCSHFSHFEQDQKNHDLHILDSEQPVLTVFYHHVSDIDLHGISVSTCTLDLDSNRPPFTPNNSNS